MARGRVAVVCLHPLFGRGIARLLGASEELEVTCLVAGLTGTAETLRQLKPDAIVLEEIEQSPSLRELMRELPPALLIGVRPHDNVMDVYYQWRVRDACPENLLRAIQLGVKGRARQVASGI